MTIWESLMGGVKLQFNLLLIKSIILDCEYSYIDGLSF